MHLPRVSSVVSFALPLAIGIVSAGAAGCVSHPWGRGFVTVGYGTSAYVVAQRPPVPQATIYPVGAAPYEGAQWVDAHWEWSGTEYVWMNGYWIRPSAHYAFVQPRWESRDGGYVYVEGGWTDRAGMIVVPGSRVRDYDERAATVVAPRPTATVHVAAPARDERVEVVTPAQRSPVVVAPPHEGGDHGEDRRGSRGDGRRSHDR